MKIWVDDVRPAPEGYNYVWKQSVLDTKFFIEYCEEMYAICKYNFDDDAKKKLHN